MRENKVTFGLRNVHYAPINNENGVITFDTPKPIPGGVELSLEPRGDMFEFYADDMTYHASPNNQGYVGTLSIASIPHEFSVAVLVKEFYYADCVLIESECAKSNLCAFFCEIVCDSTLMR